jgi:hypothetical protein
VSASETGSASGSTQLLPDEYQGLIESVRETANAMIPRNATVLVISRGDEELLRIGPRRALHFPQDEFGRYLGYHPEDSDAAIAVLEDMRARGGEYLLVPSTAFWWLDFYEGLRKHIEDNYSSVGSNDDCMIFELAPAGFQTAGPDADTKRVPAATSTRLAAGPLDELHSALLPDDARIAVVAGRDTDLPTFGECTAVHPPDGGGGLPALLDEAGAGGAEFVVIPAAAFERLHRADEAPGSVGEWRLVTRQRHVAEIYERESVSEPAVDRPQPAVASFEPDSGASAHGERRTANGSLWQRFLNWFRNG